MSALNKWYIPLKFTQEKQLAIMKEVLIPYSAEIKFYPFPSCSIVCQTFILMFHTVLALRGSN